MPTYTTHYNLAKPLVNDPTDQDLWGGELNNDMDIIDTTMFNNAVPTGSIHTFPATVPPTGYLALDGSLVSRSTYAALWTYAQASGNIAANDGAWTIGQFSPGDGSTTFRLPDPRDQFIRGASVTNVLGANQSDAIKTHSSTVTDPGHLHQSWEQLTNTSGTLQCAGSTAAGTGKTGAASVNTDFDTGTSTTGITVSYTGATETRPVNIAWLMCIKT